MKSKVLILLFLLPAFGLSAEDAVTVKFRAVAPGLAPLAVTCPSAKPSSITIPEGARSALHAYRGSASTEFQDPAGQRVFPVQFPPGKKPLLVVLLAAESANPETLVFEEDLPTEPMGSITMINIGSRPVKATVAGSEQMIEPKAKAIFAGADKPTAFVQITSPDTGEILLSNNWGITPRGRTLVLIEWPEKAPARLVFHRITENEPLKK